MNSKTETGGGTQHQRGNIKMSEVINQQKIQKRMMIHRWKWTELLAFANSGKRNHVIPNNTKAAGRWTTVAGSADQLLLGEAKATHTHIEEEISAVFWYC